VKPVFEVMFDVFNVNIIHIQTDYSQKKIVVLITDDYELVNGGGGGSSNVC
jgi:hypothetical protein